jgi:hypothetical protein
MTPHGQAFFAMPKLKKANEPGGVQDDSVKIAFYDEFEAETLISV